MRFLENLGVFFYRILKDLKWGCGIFKEILRNFKGFLKDWGGGGGQVTFDELEHGRIFFEHEMGGVATVIQDHVGLPVVGGDTSVDAPPEIGLFSQKTFLSRTLKNVSLSWLLFKSSKHLFIFCTPSTANICTSIANKLRLFL